MEKPTKQVQIDFIIKCLNLGQERSEVLGKVGKKWETSRTTFDRLWKIAKEQHVVKRKRINDAIEQDNTIKELEAVKSNIMTAIERKIYLTKVLNGELKIKKPFVIAGKIMEYPAEPDHADRLKALAELNKMDGEYAPQKTDLTIKTEQRLLPDSFDEK